MNDHDMVVGLGGSVPIMFAMLIDELDKRGSISKTVFADLLRAAAADAEAKAPERLRQIERFDLYVMRQVAGLLARPRSEWKPVVIEGGSRQIKSLDESVVDQIADAAHGDSIVAAIGALNHLFSPHVSVAA